MPANSNIPTVSDLRLMRTTATETTAIISSLFPARDHNAVTNTAGLEIKIHSSKMRELLIRINDIAMGRRITRNQQPIQVMITCVNTTTKRFIPLQMSMIKNWMRDAVRVDDDSGDYGVAWCLENQALGAMVFTPVASYANTSAQFGSDIVRISDDAISKIACTGLYPLMPEYGLSNGTNTINIFKDTGMLSIWSIYRIGITTISGHGSFAGISL